MTQDTEDTEHIVDLSATSVTLTDRVSGIDLPDDHAPNTDVALYGDYIIFSTEGGVYVASMLPEDASHPDIPLPAGCAVGEVKAVVARAFSEGTTDFEVVAMLREGAAQMHLEEQHG